MKTFIDGLLRTAAESGGPPAAAAGAPPSPAAGDPPGSPPSSPGGPPAEIVPGDQNAPGNSPPAEIYKPEGLPDTMLGKSDKETLDNAAKALKGYRDRDASNVVPEQAEGYKAFAADMPDEVKPYLETLTADPIFDRMTAEALKDRVPLKVFQSMTRNFISVAAELGMMEPTIDEAAEREALTPEAARSLPDDQKKAAREQRMTDNFAYLDQMAARGVEQGGISKEAAEYGKTMLGDTARGHELIEYMRKLGGGGTGPSMLPGGDSRSNAREDLARRSALPENTWGNAKFNQASYDQLQEDYKKHIPD